MLVIARIRVTYHLGVEPGADTAAIDRVLGFHARRCPVARTLSGCVDIHTDLVVEEVGA